MLILILIDIQYLQNVVLSFEKGLNSQNHSSSGSHHQIKNPPRNQYKEILEINIRKTKWLIVGCYHPPSQNDNYFFYNLSKALDSLNSNYEKFLLVGDFNSEDHETEITNFLNNHEAKI